MQNSAAAQLADKPIENDRVGGRSQSRITPKSLDEYKQ